MHRMMKFGALTAIVLAAGTLTVTHGQTGDCDLAQPGCLDSSFGGGGKLLSASLRSVADAALQSVDGEQRIVAVGYVAGTRGATRWTVVRYHPDGSLDASFGSNGVVTGPVLDGSSPSSVAVQPDGKIVVSGEVVTKTYKNGVPGVVRYNANGSVDLSFGTAGVTAVPCSWSVKRCSLSGFSSSVVVQSDGKVVIGGEYYGPRLTVIRLTASGLADTSFNGNGQYIMTTALASANSVVLQTVDSGIRIVAAGNYDAAAGMKDAAIFRFNANSCLECVQNGCALLGIAWQHDQLSGGVHVLERIVPGKALPIPPLRVDQILLHGVDGIRACESSGPRTIRCRHGRLVRAPGGRCECTRRGRQKARAESAGEAARIPAPTAAARAGSGRSETSSETAS